MAKNKKQQNNNNRVYTGSKLKVIPLGGLGEVGRNMTAIEFENDIIVIDCGLGFPDDDMLGIDLVIPDVSYLQKNIEKVRAILLTHGHEDHIGALPYILRSINVPIYGTPLTLGILNYKLIEHGLEKTTSLRRVHAGDTVRLGVFNAEFIRVNHSIADSCAIAVDTPVGKLLFTGDFKVDLTPISGEPINFARLGELGNEGILALFCESTNAERPGYTMSEKYVGKSLDNIFRGCDKRIIIATFSSNVHRVQQIIDYSHKYGRKVAVTGRSMLNVLTAANEMGYMDIPSNTLIDLSDIKRFKPEEITIVTTGSQGEPMSALYRMAYAEHDKVQVSENDLVVISASAIPGNEKLITKIINELLKRGVQVLNDSVADVHVSGHGCAEELKLMQVLTKPKFFVPIHGEYKHLKANIDLAHEVGIDSKHTLIPDVGHVIEFTPDTMEMTEVVQSGKVLVDGFGVGDVGNIVLRDRRHLGQDGLIVVVASANFDEKLLLAGPDIVSRGFVYVREAEELMESVRALALEILEDCFERDMTDWNEIKNKLRDELTSYIYSRTKRKPMILPVIMNI
ncbi:MAG: ribonuclease J [Ruminococcaceae bacterium]|nr:ribonuclease J [Oscillospiraceae bacterium]